MNFVPTALVSGLIWALYHCPVILTTDYDRGGLDLYSLAVFTLFAMSSSFMLTWLRLKRAAPGLECCCMPATTCSSCSYCRAYRLK